MALHAVASILDVLYLIICMLISASSMLPFHQGTLFQQLNGLQSCLASLQSCISRNKLKLSSSKPEFLPIGNKGQQSRYLSVSYRAFRCPKLRSEICSESCLLTKSATFAHIYLWSAVYIFTKSGIYKAFTVTLIWIVQSYLQMLKCLALSNYCNSLFSDIADTDPVNSGLRDGLLMLRISFIDFALVVVYHDCTREAQVHIPS